MPARWARQRFFTGPTPRRRNEHRFVATRSRRGSHRSNVSMKTSLRRYVGGSGASGCGPLALAAAMCSRSSRPWRLELRASGSMIRVILPGELVWINKLAYDSRYPSHVHLTAWGNPQRGDCGVFYSPADGTRLVKRIVGLPGDVIESRNDRLFINGAPLAYARFRRNGAAGRVCPRARCWRGTPRPAIASGDGAAQCSSPADLRPVRVRRPVFRDGRQPRQHPTLVFLAA